MTQKLNKAPTHEVFHVAGEDDKTRWMKIGVGWSHKDNDGMNLALNYSPMVEGRTVIRKVQPKQDAEVVE